MTAGPEGVSMSRRRGPGSRRGRERTVRHRAGAIALASTVATLLLAVATAALFTVDGAIGGGPGLERARPRGRVVLRGGRRADRRAAAGQRVRLAAAPDRVRSRGDDGRGGCQHGRAPRRTPRAGPVGAVGELVAAGRQRSGPGSSCTCWCSRREPCHRAGGGLSGSPCSPWRPSASARAWCRPGRGSPSPTRSRCPMRRPSIETVFAVVSLAFAAALILAVVSVVLRFRRASP